MEQSRDVMRLIDNSPDLDDFSQCDFYHLRAPTRTGVHLKWNYVEWKLDFCGEEQLNFHLWWTLHTLTKEQEKEHFRFPFQEMIRVLHKQIADTGVLIHWKTL